MSYETLWAIQNISEKGICSLFEKYGYLPSEVWNKLQSNDMKLKKLKTVVEDYMKSRLTNFSICINKTYQFPTNLSDAKYPINLFYYKGNLDLLDTNSISIVGARNCSEEGKVRAFNLSKLLVENGYTIVSGLARGIDTFALNSAIKNKGNVIGVIGTPINQYYPPENKTLQDIIAEDFLLISHVPIYRHDHEPFNNHKVYFPQRNAIMSAISKATIIVEASDTSGTLTQARAALFQNRKLFILEACFHNKEISWPEKYVEKGAIRVKNINEIISHLI